MSSGDPLPPGWYPYDDGQRWWDGLEWGDQAPDGGRPVRSRARLIAAAVGVAVVAAGAVALFVLVLGPGNDPATSSPEAVAQEFLDAQSADDFETTCRLSSQTRQAGFLSQTWADDCAAAAVSYIDISRPSYVGIRYTAEVGDVVEDGDTATVEYALTATYTGNEPRLTAFYGTDGVTYGGVVTLLREDGVWKVDDAEQGDVYE